MVVLPAQKRKQQFLLAALVMIVVLIFIVWFIAFRILNPTPPTSPPSSGELPQTAGGEEGIPAYAIPRLDWRFISVFKTFQLFEPFSAEFTTVGRKNPFLPY